MGSDRRYELTLTLTASVRAPGATEGRIRAVTVRGDYLESDAWIAGELTRRANRGVDELAPYVERDVEDVLEPLPREVELDLESEGSQIGVWEFAEIREALLRVAREARETGNDAGERLRGVTYADLYTALPDVDRRRVSKVANYLINTTHPDRPPELGRAGDEFWYLDPKRDRRWDGRRWVVALDCAADGLAALEKLRSELPVPPEPSDDRVLDTSSLSSEVRLVPSDPNAPDLLKILKVSESRRIPSEAGREDVLRLEVEVDAETYERVRNGEIGGISISSDSPLLPKPVISSRRLKCTPANVLRFLRVARRLAGDTLEPANGELEILGVPLVKEDGTPWTLPEAKALLENAVEPGEPVDGLAEPSREERKLGSLEGLADEGDPPRTDPILLRVVADLPRNYFPSGRDELKGSIVEVLGGLGEPLARFRECALRELGASEPLSAAYEIRDASGRVLDPDANPLSLKLAPKAVLYLEPPAGAGTGGSK